MEGRPETASLLDLAARAEDLGFDSVWVGDSLLARPRHDPLTLLAAVAARTRKGDARHRRLSAGVAQSGGAGAPAGDARPDQRGAAGARGRHRQRRAQYPRGIRRCRRAVRRPRRADDGGTAPGPRVVDGEAGRLAGPLAGAGGVLGPTPYRAGGPPIWMAGSVRPALERAARHFDGWFANEADLARWTRAMGRGAADAPRGRARSRPVRRGDLCDPGDRRGCQPRRAADRRLSGKILRAAGRGDAPAGRAATAGPAAGAAEYLAGFASAGASHIIVRFAGDPERQLEELRAIRTRLGW